MRTIASLCLPLFVLALVLLLMACGPSESEIQTRAGVEVTKQVAEIVTTTAMPDSTSTSHFNAISFLTTSGERATLASCERTSLGIKIFM